MQRGALNPYPALNWVTLSAVAGESIPEADPILAQAETAARERFAKTHDFFDACGDPGCEGGGCPGFGIAAS